jgi:oligosaccharide repeat unit polymerase
VNSSILLLFMLLLPITTISVVVSLRFYKSIISPIFIQMSIWIVTLWFFVFFTNWLYFLNYLKSITVIYIAFALIIQLVAAIIFLISFSILSKNKEFKVVKFEKGINFSFGKLAIYIVNIMSLGTSIIFLINIIQIYGINFILDNSVLVRRAFFTSELNLIIGTDIIIILLNASMILSGAYVVTTVIFNKKDFKILIFPIFSSMIFGLGFLSRVEVIKTLIVIYSAVELRKIKKKELELGLIKFRKVTMFIILSVFIFISFTMGKGTVIYNTNNLFLGTIKNIVSYATGSIIAFQEYLLNTPTQYNFGYSSFYPIYRQLFNIGLFEERLTSYVNVYSQTALGINTFTFLRPFHEDFGFLGLIIMPFLFIISSMYIYNKVMIEKKASFLNTSILLSFYPAIVFSIQGFEFQTNGYFIGISLAFVVAAIINNFSAKKIIQLRGDSNE